MRPHSDLTAWDASPNVKSLYKYPFLFLLSAMLCLPCLFVSQVDFLCIFTRLLTCPCMSLVCWYVLSTLQHNEVMDIQSKLTFVPRRHNLLCVFSFVCLLTRLLALVLPCLPCLLCLSILGLFIYSLHPFPPLLVCWFFVFAFVCTHMEQGRTELGHGLPGASKKGASASMWIWAKQLSQ